MRDFECARRWNKVCRHLEGLEYDKHSTKHTKKQSLIWPRIKIYWLIATLSLIAPSSAQNLVLTEVTDSLVQNPPKESCLGQRGGVESWGYSGLIKLIAVT